MPKKIEFKPTDEMKRLVGDVPSGERFELMTEYAAKDNGDWCVTRIEGVPAPGYDAEGHAEEADKSPMDGKSQFATNYETAMKGA